MDELSKRKSEISERIIQVISFDYFKTVEILISLDRNLKESKSKQDFKKAHFVANVKSKSKQLHKRIYQVEI